MRIAIVLVPALLLCSCKPDFKPTGGGLTLAGQAFQPVRCQVNPGRGGIDLFAADGAHLAAIMPPRRLDAFQDLSGVAQVKFTASGKPEQDLGSCGTLTLTGEGYHGDGKRAARGKLVLACSAAQGELTFTGCF